MTRDEHFANVINELDKGDDPERAHVFADDMLVSVLKLHGYTKTAEAFSRMTKWYG